MCQSTAHLGERLADLSGGVKFFAKFFEGANTYVSMLCKESMKISLTKSEKRFACFKYSPYLCINKLRKAPQGHGLRSQP